jgi:tetratricopeptide (TPR) repeat protein
MPAGNFIKTLSVAVILLALFLIIFGSVLPFIKSERYVSFLGVSSSAKTLEEFESYARTSLDFGSPVGQEETVKFMLSATRDIIRNPNIPAPIAGELVRFIELYAFKNDVRHLAAMGDMYSTLWARYGDESAFARSEEYYKKALVIGPNLPPVLYSLLTIYQLKGDGEKIKETSGTILSYWPNDNSVRQLLDSVSLPPVKK